MRRMTALGVLALAATLFASPARAGIGNDLAEELEGYVETALSEGDTTAKRAALLTYGYFADGEQQDKIAEYKSADEAPVRLAAGLALWRAGADDAKSFVLEELKKHSPLYPVLRRELTVLPDNDERELLEALVEDGDSSTRKDVFRYLGRQHGTLYELLSEFVGSSDDDIRDAAINALRTTARVEALDVIESDLVEASDESKQVRGIELVIFFSQFPGRVSTSKEVLKRALEHDNPEIVEKAGERLLELHDNSAVEPLTSLMAESDDMKTKKRLARMLLDHRVTPPAEKVTSLYKEASMALSSDGGPPEGAGGEEVVVDEELAQLYLELSAASGKSQVFEKIKHMFGTTHFGKRLKAAKALGFIDKSEAVDLLGKALFEGSEKMRLAAARSLRQTARKEAIPALKRSISQERSKKVKAQVLRALGAIGTEKALRILRFNSRTRNKRLREAVIAAVKEAGSKRGFETLRLYLNSRDLDIQWRAFVVSLQIAPDEAMKRLDKMLRNPPDGFMRDLRELSAERQKLVYPELLTHDNDRVRRQAFRSAVRIGEPLHDVFRDLAFESDTFEDTRKRCLRALSELRAAEDRPRFEKLVRNSDSLEFKTLAAWTLAEYASGDLEATFRGFVTSDSSLIKALGAYGLARIADAEE